MRPESPPPMNEMISYFVTQLPDKWNILTHEITFTETLECEPICLAKYGLKFQFAVIGVDSNGFARGWAINLN
jgi:hypothetical protein